MKLSDRVFHCQKCDSIIDRDLNTSINLENAPKEKVRSARPERTDTQVCPCACGQEEADFLGGSRKKTPGQINKFS